MLRQLKISNYALIDQVELDFGKGLTAITGETGSGKSILLGAFGLLLGERAESRSIQDATTKCVVEAQFDLKGYGLKAFFSQNDLDYDQQTTIRREISSSGKSRAFINDTPVQLSTLRALGSVLVDIHSQHENSMLGDRAFQFGTVDAFAGNQTLISSYDQAFSNFKALTRELEELELNEGRMKQELDYARFQWNELDKAALETLRQSEMEQELETLNHAEQIKNIVSVAVSALEGDREGVLNQLGTTRTSLQKIASLNDQLQEFSARMDSCLIELRELSRELGVYETSVNLDEKRILELNERLSMLYQLQKKHRLQTVSELIDLREELGEKCNRGENLDERIDSLRGDVEKGKQLLEKLSFEITLSRRKGAEVLCLEVKEYFSALSLEHAELVVELKPAPDFGPFGKDDIQFLFKANKGGQLLPVKQVASGGEISRVMLALKASVSKHRKLPVLILDEIDQGVSGEVGKKIGLILKEMSRQMQLLTITHLPQIAGKADHHHKVSKISEGERTVTVVENLNEDARINELAEMLSGKSYSKAALENARELLG